MILLVRFILETNAQHIEGRFSDLKSTEIKLEIFKGFETETIATTKSNGAGFFSLTCPTPLEGMGRLSLADGSAILIAPGDETILLEGTDFQHTENVRTITGKENKILEDYSRIQLKRTLSSQVWDYLLDMYSSHTLTKSNKQSIRHIKREKKKLLKASQKQMSAIDENSYMRYYLPMRELINSLPYITAKNQAAIPAYIQQLRDIDHSDDRLYASGLWYDLFSAHILIIENSGKPLTEVYTELNKSIDVILSNLEQDPTKYNAVSDYLFTVLEQRSLFGSSEYLALKVLEDQACFLESEVTAKLESYRKLKRGATAPDITFYSFLSENTLGGALNLSELASPYCLLFFGSSECSACIEAFPAAGRYYPTWKKAGLELLFISLDTNQYQAKSFASPFAFPAIYDGMGWKGRAALDYHIFATPSFFLLAKNRRIVLRPLSLEQVDAWVKQELTYTK